MNFLSNLRQLLVLQYSRNGSTGNITSTMSKVKNIKTFVFLDLETTGLPHLEHNLTKITELCAVAVQADHIELGCFPRVHNKLTFCFNPRKIIYPETTEITGLSNELLEHQAQFSSDFVDIFNKWLGSNQEPVCLVAHNGNKFDFPILKAEIENSGNTLMEGVFCIDSLVAFRSIDQSHLKEEVDKSQVNIVQSDSKRNTVKRKGVPFEFDEEFNEVLASLEEDYLETCIKKKCSPEYVQKINETTPKKQLLSTANSLNVVPKRHSGLVKKQFVSYKLGDVYTRLTGKQPINVHEAEGDVNMLITCAATYGEKFVSYVNENCNNFSEVQKMTPGRKII